MKIAVGCDHGGLHLKQEIKDSIQTFKFFFFYLWII